MKHKQYENWILNDTVLSPKQKEELDAHLLSCQRCYSLYIGWNASKQLIGNAVQQKPGQGFATRWKQTVEKKKQTEKIRRHRLSIFLLIVLVFSGAILYMITSGTAIQSFTNSFTILSDLVIKLTSGLSAVGYWIHSVPIAIPITMGFLFFGLFSAFMMSCVFFLWNLRRKELIPNEIQVD